MLGWLRRIVGKSAPDAATRQYLRVVTPHGNNSYTDWTAYRPELAGHFRGWNYCAIHNLACEIAGLHPQVARVVDIEEQEQEVQKSLRDLRACKSLDERRLLTLSLNRKRARRKRMKTKALARLQHGDELDHVSSDHPLVKLLANPNEPDTAWTHNYKLVMNLRLTGSTFQYLVRNRLGGIAAMWVLPSHWVHAHGSRERLVDWYEVRPAQAIFPDSTFLASGWMPGYSGNGRIGPDDMIRISYPSPLSLMDGFAPLQAGGTWVDISESIDNSRVNTFYNAWFPGVVVQLAKEVENPDEPMIERIQDKIAEKYAGVRSNKKPVVLGPGMTLVPMSNPVDLDYANSASGIRDDILSLHRTGKSQLGQVEFTSMANMLTARASYYQSAVKPELQLIGSVLTEKLAPAFGEKLVVYWEDPCPDDPEMELKKEAQGLANGLVSPNEARTERGNEPWEHGGDNPMLPMGLQEMPWATGEMQGPQAPQNGGDEQHGDGQHSDLASLLGLDGKEPDGGKQPGNASKGDGHEPAASPSPSLPTPLAKRLNGRVRARK